MSQELERLLRVSAQSEPPAWLDQLVLERVLEHAQRPSLLAVVRSQGAAAAVSAFRTAWQLLRRGALELRARTRRGAPGQGCGQLELPPPVL